MSHLAAIYTNDDPPFKTHSELYNTINTIRHGDSPWQSFAVKYSHDLPKDPPAWMTDEYDIWHRNPLVLLEHQIANPDFHGAIDYAPKVVTDKWGDREVCDLMSGQWAWDQCVRIKLSPAHESDFIA